MQIATVFQAVFNRRPVFPRIAKIAALFAGILVLPGVFDLNAQTIYQGPATGSITGGSPVSTDQFTNVPEPPLQPHRRRILNPFWEHFNPPYVEDRFNQTPAAAPAGSNEFYDPAVSNLSPGAVNAPYTVIDFEGNLETNSIPPDPIMAVGPDHLVTMVNSQFNFYDKQGNRLFSRSADAWFSNVMPYSGAFDPIVVYDNIDERWVMCWDLQDDNSQTGYWLVSVSDDADPMGTWCNFSFPAHLNGMTNVNNWGDYQKMGYDHQAVYITGRQFAFGGGLQYCKLRIIPKSELYDPTCPPVSYTDFWDFRDPNNSGQRVDGPPIVASHLEAPGNVAYMLVDAPYSTSTFITLWKIDDPLGNPTLSAVNISTTAAPQVPDANQLGGGTPLINTGRRAYRNAVYYNGSLWTATAIGGGNGFSYAFARYLRLDVINDAVLEDVSFGANGFYYYYPAIMVDEDENMVMAFTRSADTEYAGAGVTGRRSIDPPGLGPTFMFKEGEANYVKTFGGTRNRWGDYMGIAPDPANPSVIWTMVEYAKSPANTWGNWIGAFTYKYALNGVVSAAAGGDPLENARVRIAESGAEVLTGADGSFEFGAPGDTVTLSVNKFEFAPYSQKIALQPYFNIPFNVSLDAELQAAFTGQIRDIDTGEGIFARVEYFAKDNPDPGPYFVFETDTNGFFDVSTFIGDFDIVIHPASPYPYTKVEGLALDTLGLELDINLSPADVLVVDDDDGSDYEKYYFDALKADSLNYHHWDVAVVGEAPTAVDFSLYPNKTVIWFTGDSDGNAINENEAGYLLEMLNSGGKLFLSGQDIVEELDSTVFMTELGIGFAQNTSTPVVRGEAGSAIGNGLILITGAGAAGNQTSRDQLLINDDTYTTQEFRYGATAEATAGISYLNNDNRAVLLGFGFEAITDETRRKELVATIMDFFQSPVGIENGTLTDAPRNFALHQNYPNPFNPETTIRFAVPQRGKVTLQIYNMLGQKVRTLADASFAPGTHELKWDGRDDSGNSVTSGIYFYRISAGSGFTTARKMILMK